MTWRLDVATLNALWADAYPKMVGHAWLDDAYQARFTSGDVQGFLKKELEDRGIDIPNGVALKVYADDQVDFEVLPTGELWLPNPRELKPQDAQEIYRNYKDQTNFRRGGRFRFPGLGGLSLIPSPEAPATRRRSSRRPTSRRPSRQESLHGRDFLQIIESLPQALADVWTNHGTARPAERERVLRLEFAVRDKFPFPNAPEMTPNVREGRLDAYLTGNGTTWEFYLPMPPPPSKDELFRLFASGEAANPMYTGTVGGGQ